MSGRDKKPVSEWTQADVEKILQGIDLKEEAKEVETRRLASLARTASLETAAVVALAEHANQLQSQAEVASVVSLT